VERSATADAEDSIYLVAPAAVAVATHRACLHPVTQKLLLWMYVRTRVDYDNHGMFTKLDDSVNEYWYMAEITKFNAKNN